MNGGEMTCANGHPIAPEDATAKFCRLCGESLLKQCPDGHVSPSWARFCKTCGLPLATEQPVGSATASTTVAQVGPPFSEPLPATSVVPPAPVIARRQPRPRWPFGVAAAVVLLVGGLARSPTWTRTRCGRWRSRTVL